MSQVALVIPERGAQPKITTVSVPEVKAGEVLVKILAAGVNPHENLTINTGLFAESFPYILGSDGAGIVEQIGPSVTNVKIGDLVVMHGDIFDASTATFQQYAKTDADLIAKIPPNITVEQAATVPVAVAAVFVGLYHSTGLHLTPPWIHEGIGKYKGQGIFIVGGASSVGQFAIQLAKLSGFSTIATTASESNHKLVTSLGATHVFSRSSSAANIKSAIGPIKLGFDAIATPETQALDLQVLERAEDSDLIVVREPTQEPKNDAAPIKARWTLGSSVRTKEISVPFWAAVEGWLKDGTLKPNRVEVLPGGLGAVSEALDRLKRGTVSGKKLVIKPQETDSSSL